jgi:2-polyprenyl-3-methyl-5-hydroxy-6-metoxy-1,4-benzoquinol methylase
MEKTVKNQEVKDRYADIISGKYEGDYEFNRWFTTMRDWMDYYMTYRAIKFHLGRFDFTNCLELGPGPGTWTRLLFRRKPGARFDLVDISAEMRGQFMLDMREQENVNYVLSDIMDFEGEDEGEDGDGKRREYDLFFSSRAIEYLEDQKGLIAKLHGMIAPGGHGLVVTKNPAFNPGLFGGMGFGRAKRSKRSFHSGQMLPEEFKSFLEEVGFKNVQFYPVIFRMAWDRFGAGSSMKKFHKFFEKPLTAAQSRYCESYIISFEK